MCVPNGRIGTSSSLLRSAAVANFSPANVAASLPGGLMLLGDDSDVSFLAATNGDECMLCAPGTRPGTKLLCGTRTRPTDVADKKPKPPDGDALWRDSNPGPFAGMLCDSASRSNALL